ncbi:hypothetical protein [Phenylobacterium sp.]|uniref:hypothetical protein n=1 Tax=Phenylobacterium sp. TaxID=1871053 RepID=UPI0035B39DAE
MNRAELERHAALLFGRDEHGKPKHGWQVRLAERVPGKSGRPISRETVRLWLRDDEVPAWAAAFIRAMASISPPSSTAEVDRVDACMEALAPELARLRDIAVSVGWRPDEIAAAIVALTVGKIGERDDDATDR